MELPIQNYEVTKLHYQMDEIDETTKKLYNIKQEIIVKLEETKRSIRTTPTTSTSMKHPDLRETGPSILVREKTVSLLDRDISHIQNLHDVIVQDLEQLKHTLDNHIGIVEKTELIMNILNYKLYEIQYAFRTQLSKLQKRRLSLIKGSSDGQDESNVALQIVEIDDEISNLEQNQQREMACVKEQKIDAQKSYERACQSIDQNFEKMSDGFDKLLLLIEAEKSTLGASQSKFIESKYAVEVDKFRNNIERFTELQTTGWKVLYPDEKISEMLHQRGLKVHQTGVLITDEGHTITFKQAKAKLLDDVGPKVLEELKASLTGAEHDHSFSSTKSDMSSGSKVMSSEDIDYLKACLGKPLTLAVAEITAVQPRDPIHYLGHWLFKYRYNKQMEDVDSIEFEILNNKRTELAKERWHKFVEEEARAAVIDMIVHAEEIGIMNALRRIQEEADALEETENYDDEARDILGPYTGPPTGQVPL